mgnify:FL=1
MKRKLLYSKKADEHYGAYIAVTKDGVEYRFTCNHTADGDWKEFYGWDDTVEVVELEEKSFVVTLTKKCADYLNNTSKHFPNEIPKIQVDDQTIARIREWAEQNLPLLKWNEDKREARSSKIP